MRAGVKNSGKSVTEILIDEKDVELLDGRRRHKENRHHAADLFWAAAVVAAGLAHGARRMAAQPPGKKLQLLSLLSGGEKALTAIAILFAMLKLKPTPFCILDEIEAALDEANISYFAEYLAEYAKSTQFIIITHRKGTMECCDALYGVAMEERGVSGMVSVNLQQYTEV